MIYDTNMRQAYNAGRWDRGQNSVAHTHIMYLVGPSRKHRKQHLAWSGLVLPKDAPFWSSHAPMNAWGCKCHLRFLTRQRLEKLRRDGIPDATNVKNGRAVGRTPIKERAPAEKMRTYVNKSTRFTALGTCRRSRSGPGMPVTISGCSWPIRGGRWRFG